MNTVLKEVYLDRDTHEVYIVLNATNYSSIILRCVGVLAKKHGAKYIKHHVYEFKGVRFKVVVCTAREVHFILNHIREIRDGAYRTPQFNMLKFKCPFYKAQALFDMAYSEVDGKPKFVEPNYEQTQYYYSGFGKS